MQNIKSHPFDKLRMTLRTAKGHMLRNKSKSGFTLLELTIVFSLMAVLGAIGFAAFTNFSSRQTLDQTAQDIKAGIDQAKFSAISRVKPSSCAASNILDGYTAVICTTGGLSACTAGNLYELKPACIPVPNPSPIPLSKKISANITVSVTSCGILNNNAIFFSAQIGTSNGLCTIRLTDDTGSSKTVCVDNGGNVSILDGAVNCPTT